MIGTIIAIFTSYYLAAFFKRYNYKTKYHPVPNAVLSSAGHEDEHGGVAGMTAIVLGNKQQTEAANSKRCCGTKIV